MEAQALYDAITEAIEGQAEAGPLNPYELIGVLEQIKGECLAALMFGDDEEGEPEA